MNNNPNLFKFISTAESFQRRLKNNENKISDVENAINNDANFGANVLNSIMNIENDITELNDNLKLFNRIINNNNVTLNIRFLKFWYEVDFVDGSTALDKSGNNNDGQLIDVTVEDDAFFEIETGKILTPYSLPTNIENIKLSFSLWLKDDNASFIQTGTGSVGDVQLIGNYQTSSTANSVALFYRNTGGTSFRVFVRNSTDGGVVDFDYNFPNFDNNEWHHLVMTLDGEKAKLYIDNIFRDEVETEGGFYFESSNQPFFVGGGHLNRYQDARMKDIRLYENYALTENDIDYLYSLHSN